MSPVYAGEVMMKNRNLIAENIPRIESALRKKTYMVDQLLCITKWLKQVTFCNEIEKEWEQGKTDNS
jgi:hypothetical protein